MASVGSYVVAIDTTRSVQNTAGTTASTSYTSSLGAGTACGLVFTVPPSGKVKIYSAALMYVLDVPATNTWCTVRVRTGSTIGSGSDVLAASDNHALHRSGAGSGGATRVTLLEGLTAGDVLNVQQLFRTEAGTLNMQMKELIVELCP